MSALQIKNYKNVSFRKPDTFWKYPAFFEYIVITSKTGDLNRKE